jgi:ribosomal protein S18 acetylase RimI-like enzyme
MEPIEESVQLMIDCWKMYVGRLPSGTVEHSEGVVAALGNVEFFILNLCLHYSPLVGLDDLRRRVGLATERAADCPFPWLFCLCEDWAPSEWEAVVGEYGLEPAVNVIGMAADELKPPRRTPPNLEYRRVQDAATARDLAELNMQAYGLPLEMGECICNLHLWKEDSYGYVGYVDGQPVTCAATFPVNNTVYVAFVATYPDVQRQGCAEAVMRHSIEKGAEGMGLSRTTLHATEAGFPLYLAMGYEATAPFRMLAEPHAEDR